MSAPATVPVARAGADLRLLRTAVFTAVCVLLSAGGHAMASCASVPAWTLAAGFVVLFAAVAPLAGRERSLPGIAAVLTAGQLGLHALFGLGQGALAMAAPTPASDGSEGRLIAFAARLICNHPGRLTAAEAHRLVADSGISPSTVHSMTGAAGLPADAAGLSHLALLQSLLPTLPMVLGHLLAGLAAGWLLRRGEAALWRAVRLSAQAAHLVADTALVLALRAALRLVRAALRAGAGEESAAATVRRPARRPYENDEAAPRELALTHSVVRRGPPHCALAA
ncbi:hypothetical protein AB0I49_03700 [Streptomyces sp. NPDC050617]|uniref:hypothetical protein n=1 Tax=Streptomyces sp. NPDC050617 TaxID=3154628 RepID=UPI00343F7C76